MEHLGYTGTFQKEPRRFLCGAAVFFAPRPAAAAAASVGPAVQTAPVGLSEAPAPQYDLMTDLLHLDMFKVFGHVVE
jgi:hypothetical protein